MAARRARRSPSKNRNQERSAAESGVQSAPLEPIDYKERELTRPDGSTVTVRVPVYPPFKLRDRKSDEQKKAS
ncbi:MAG: hypothetical protein ACR2P8_00935 [Myxococcota bacterium]